MLNNSLQKNSVIKIILYIRNLVLSLFMLAGVHLLAIVILILARMVVDFGDDVSYFDSLSILQMIMAFMVFTVAGIVLLPLAEYRLFRFFSRIDKRKMGYILIIVTIALLISLGLLMNAHHDYGVTFVAENCGPDGCGDPHDNYFAPMVEYSLYILVGIVNLVVYMQYNKKKYASISASDR